MSEFSPGGYKELPLAEQATQVGNVVIIDGKDPRVVWSYPPDKVCVSEEEFVFGRNPDGIRMISLIQRGQLLDMKGEVTPEDALSNEQLKAFVLAVEQRHPDAFMTYELRGHVTGILFNRVREMQDVIKDFVWFSGKES
ncbi:MAG: hypothetical protein M3Q36_02145 [bacterium]|nr:hypothetical protein [bacterium]